MFGSLGLLIEGSSMLTMAGVAIVGIITFIILRKPLETEEHGLFETDSKEQSKPDTAHVTVADPLDAATHIKLAKELTSQYRFEEALTHLQAALKQKDDDPLTHFQIGRIFLQTEDFTSAILAFRNVTRLEPGHVPAQFDLARALIKTGKLDEAHHALQAILKLDPAQEEALKLKAMLYQKTGDAEKALQLIRQLLELRDLSRDREEEYRRLYADCLYSVGEMKEAIREYMHLLGNSGGRSATYYQLQVASSYLSLNDYENATQTYRNLLNTHEHTKNETKRMESDEVSDVQTKLVASLCGWARQMLVAQNPHRAVALYLEALTVESHNPDLYYELAQIYHNAGDMPKATRYYEEAVIADPAHEPSLFQLALIHDSEGHIEEGIRYYQKCLVVNPEREEAAFGLGTLFGFQGDLHSAVQWLSEAIRLNPVHVDAIYNLAVALEQLSQLNKAITLYQQVLELDPTHLEATSNLQHLREQIKTEKS